VSHCNRKPQISPDQATVINPLKDADLVDALAAIDPRKAKVV
jgi:hypothetical protein